MLDQFYLYPVLWRHFDANGDGGGGGDGGGDNEGGDGGTPKTYTKAEVDGMVNKALERARREFADYAELKDKAAQLATLQEQSLSAEERLRKQHDSAIRERDAALGQAREALVRSAIITEASKQGAVDPDAVAALLPQEDISVEGQRVEGVPEAVRALLATKPYLLEKGARTRAGGEMGDSSGGNGRSRTVRVAQSEHREWLRRGITDDEKKLVETAIRTGNYVTGR
jgi:outer membrane translocation and assembly module TamA